MLSDGYALSPLSSLNATVTLALQEISSFLPEIVQILTLIPIKETLILTLIPIKETLIPIKESDKQKISNILDHETYNYHYK